MSLYDFFFPEQAQATHLRRLADSQGRRSRAQPKSSALGRRVDELEDDIGYLALVLGALLQQVDDKGVVTREDVRATLAELDELDGVKDGKLDVAILRGMGQ